MNQESSDALAAVLDQVDCGRPPVGQLLTLGHLRRRRRRLAVLGTGAAAVLLLGCGLVAGLSATGGRALDPATSALEPHATALDTRVESGFSNQTGALFTSPDPFAQATWDAATGTLVYVSSMSYSSSCPPTATAGRSGDGLELELEDGQDEPDGFGFVCTADAGAVTVIVTGLDAPPSELTVTEAEGTTTVPVQGPTLSSDEFALAVRTAEDAQAVVTGTFVGATAIAVDGSVPGSGSQGCPDARLIQVRVVWLADANFVHGGVPGGPPDGPRKAQGITVDAATGEVCSQGASYRQVGASPGEVLLYGSRP